MSTKPSPSNKPSESPRLRPSTDQQHEVSAATASAAIAALPPDQHAALERRFALIIAAFDLDYFDDDEGKEDAHVIRRSKSRPVFPPPNDRRQRITVSGVHKESFYVVKLALRIGMMPLPQVDHKDRNHANYRLVNLRVAPVKDNNRNKATPRKRDAHLPKGVYAKRNRKGSVIAYYAKARDADGRKLYLGYFPLSKYSEFEAIRAAAAAFQAFVAPLHGSFFNPPSLSQPAFRPQ